MIESIEFTNFKALRHTILPLSPFTLLLGPNGSGKTTILQALRCVCGFAMDLGNETGVARSMGMTWKSLVSVAADDKEPISIKLHLRGENHKVEVIYQWDPHDGRRTDNFSIGWQFKLEDGRHVHPSSVADELWWLRRMRTYVLDASAIAQPVPVSAGPMQSTGFGLAAVLDDMKDNHPERFDLLLEEMQEWLPEYDYVLFEKPIDGHKGIMLRTVKGRHRIPAKDLSQGTLVALALLTLAYLPDPPTLIGLEEIDRGLHPRLLRHLQDALYRLAYPQSCGELRPPIQVIATTHSPYLLDLYRDHPQEVVLAEKKGLEVEMKRLSDIEHYEEILGDAPLSDIWYSGVLGGATVKP